jgi:hypothetical protein
MKIHIFVLSALALVATGCAGASSGSGSPKSNPNDGYSGSGGFGGWSPGLSLDAAAIGGGGGTTTTLPPEQEQDLDFLAPRAGATYVYVANPTRNTVTAINSAKLAITELAPGDSPTYLTTVPGQDIALVINTGSHTLRVLHADQLVGDPIPVVAKANAIAVAPDGRHAVIWFDAAQQLSGTTPASTTGSTQEVSVVDLSATRVTSMSVGFNPSAVVFSQDSSAAFVVTDDGISELRFATITGPAIAPFTRIDSTTTAVARPDAGTDATADTQAAPADTRLPPAPPPGGSSADLDGGGAPVDGDGAPVDGGDSPVDGRPAPAEVAPALPDLAPASPDLRRPDSSPPDTAPASSTALGKPIDVSVTIDGAYAVARREGSAELLLVDLTTHKVTALNLSSAVTDLDVLPSGTAAFAVLRDEHTLVRIDIPAGFSDPTHRFTWPALPGVTIGSVTLSGRGKYAVLYTTTGSADTLVIVDLTVPDIQPQAIKLQKAIRAVAVAPDEQTALVLHAPPSTSGAGGASGAGGSSGSADKSYGYTMVRLEDGFSKLQVTAADPNPFTLTPDSLYAFVLLRDDKAGVRIAERISLTSFLADDFALNSPPNSIAALSLEAHKVFVGQVYSEGRISFIDWQSAWESGSAQTVTGFALNGRIQQ